MSITLHNNDTGINFEAVVSNREDKPIVDIYDRRWANKNGFGPNGQIAASYYVETILSHSGGLQLAGDVKDWRLSADNVAGLRAYLAFYL